ncbi:MAG TPA: hypothetical protein VEL70_03225 [Candidatus Acidoferrum sp.]|nr:hypothetical protein [Candidatus Acidoferrum sp.]
MATGFAFVLVKIYQATMIHLLLRIFLIWSHQIGPDREEKLVCGRGSPEMKFSRESAKEDRKMEFEGALPTTKLL